MYVSMLALFAQSCNKNNNDDDEIKKLYLKTTPDGSELDVERASLMLYDNTKRGGYRLIYTQELQRRIEEGEKFFIIDTRNAQLFQQSHLVNAVNIPAPVENAGTLMAKFQQALKTTLPEDKFTQLLIYASSMRDPRSHIAAQLVIKLGYRYVYRMPAGFAAWDEVKYPTTRK